MPCFNKSVFLISVTLGINRIKFLLPRYHRHLPLLNINIYLYLKTVFECLTYILNLGARSGV